MPQKPNQPSVSPSKTHTFEKATLPSIANGYYCSRIYTSNVNINPLIMTCDHILSLAVILKTTKFPADYDRFFQDLVHEIHSFEHHAQIANYQSNTILNARYALCCLLDETIATEWYQNSNPPEKTLLSMFYNENNGNERFFSIIENALEDPETNLHLIELMYLCLNLGFTGKYRNTQNEQNALPAITNRLYQIISQHNHLDLKNIFINKPSLSQKKLSSFTHTSTTINIKKLLGITIATAIIISSIILFGINFKLNKFSKPIIYSIIEQRLKHGNE